MEPGSLGLGSTYGLGFDLVGRCRVGRCRFGSSWLSCRRGCCWTIRIRRATIGIGLPAAKNAGLSRRQENHDTTNRCENDQGLAIHAKLPPCGNRETNSYDQENQTRLNGYFLVVFG